MPFDFKREYRDLYVPVSRPHIIDVPAMNYAAVSGSGDPNIPGGAYQQALGVLYSLSYTLKMSYKSSRPIDGFFPYVVPPLEGFWHLPPNVSLSDKSSFSWISAIRLPDFVHEADLRWAADECARKKGLDCSSARFFPAAEGLCVQMLHIGSYDSEPASLSAMEKYAECAGFCLDLSESRLHHEIYLSDPRRTAPEKLKTVLRLPVKSACK